MTTTNREFVERCFQNEFNSEKLARQNFSRLNHIMRRWEYLDSDLHDRIMDIKVLRMKKVMFSHAAIILTEQQAKEIWGD